MSTVNVSHISGSSDLASQLMFAKSVLIVFLQFVAKSETMLEISVRVQDIRLTTDAVITNVCLSLRAASSII